MQYRERKRPSCPFGIRRSRTTEALALPWRSRGTGPRATVSRAACRCDREGQALALRGQRAPRRRDLPVSMQYLKRKRSSHRRARACPSPCCLNKNPSIYGNGQHTDAIARDRPSRYGKPGTSVRSRGTGPRATVYMRLCDCEGQALALRGQRAPRRRDLPVSMQYLGDSGPLGP